MSEGSGEACESYDAVDRRRWARVPGGFDVLLDAGNVIGQVEAKNISGGGMLLNGLSGLCEGDRAYMSFILPAVSGASEVKVIGSVIRVGTQENCRGVAVAYDVLLPGAGEAITQYVENMICWVPGLHW